MKKIIMGLALALAISSPVLAQDVNRETKSDKLIVAQAAAITPAQNSTTTVETSSPLTTTTKVSGGSIAAAIIEWLQVAFGTAIGGGIVAGIVKGMQLLGLKIDDSNRKALYAIVVNGLNDAAAKAAVNLRADQRLDVSVKPGVVADAVDYVQRHAPETIKALGLDPKSGEAVEVIKARIETALNDPNTPTPPEITPDITVNGVKVQGTKV